MPRPNPERYWIDFLAIAPRSGYPEHGSGNLQRPLPPGIEAGRPPRGGVVQGALQFGAPQIGAAEIGIFEVGAERNRL